MYTDAMAINELIRLLFTFYLTLAIMGIGFGMMLAGSSGARAAARLFLQRPVQLLWASILAVIAAVFARSWMSFASLLARIGRALKREVKELAADLRWLVTLFSR